MKFDELYESLNERKTSDKLEDIYWEFIQALQDATGDVAYEYDPDHGYFNDDDISHYYRLAVKDDLDPVDFIASSLYDDAYWVSNWGADRLYDIVAQKLGKSDRSTYKEVAKDLAEIAKSKGNKSLHTALLGIAGEKKIKKPKYKPYVSPKARARKAKATRNKNLSAKIAKLPAPPKKTSGEINKDSKLVKKNSSTYQANDGKFYSQVGSNWYELSESLVEELKLDEAGDKIYYVANKRSGNIIWGYTDSAKEAKRGFFGFDSKLHKVISAPKYLSADE